MRGRILVVDDEAPQRDILRTILEAEGFAVETSGGARDAVHLCREQVFDVVLSDQRMPDGDGLLLLEELRKLEDPPEVILMTAYGSIDSAVQAMRMGAFDYLAKPLERAELLIRIERAFQSITLRQENRLLHRQLEERFRADELTGSHATMREVKQVLAKISPSNSTVLVVGESGTGKELVARAIHRNSPRRDRPLVAVSCAAIPETLLESELFGYERGAFTGATARRTGLIEEADRSTLFLDEIGELDPTMQAKILRFLQERKVRRVGGREDIRVDVRVIAATNRDLEAEIRRGKFREDLYYRLNWIRITLPPLRERSTDIPELVGHFIAKSNAAAGKSVQGIATEALRVLMGYAWPGNVRQLESVIDRAVLLTDGEVIGVGDLPIEVRQTGPAPGPARGGGPFDLPEEGILIEEWERRLIAQAMERSGWVIAKAAKMLGMSYKTLQYRLEKFQIRKSQDTANEVAAT